MLSLAVNLLALSTVVRSSAPHGPWDEFNFAPTSRTVYPAVVRYVEGSVQAANNLVANQGSATLAVNGSWVALDFGKEVGGLISLNFEDVSSTSSIALSFTESPSFISPLTSDDSTNSSPNMSYDGVLHVPSPLPSGYWVQPAARLRGGFRFLTIVLNSNDPVTISNVSCSLSFMPHFDNLRKYSGYFYAMDPAFRDQNFLTKIWYSGAYTVQTNTVPLHTGRQVPVVKSPGWQNNATLGVAGPIIVDGAKRDRAVWPGDMGVSVPTQFVSTNDLLPTKNALSTMFVAQNPTTGALPESGPPLSQQGSDTYHAWTLIGLHNYFLYSGDVDWLQTVWVNYTKAVAFLENKVDNSGLMNVTGLRDWGRQGGGGHNAEELAGYLNETDLSAGWSRNASALKTIYNEVFWMPELGMYRDNISTTLCPQDANSMAILYNLTTSEDQAASISAGLEKNWNDIGAVAPELPDNISPFIGSLEVSAPISVRSMKSRDRVVYIQLSAHFQSGNDARAMDLLRREWGYMLYTNLSVQSTLLEGYTGNGSLLYRSYQGYSYDAAYTSHSHGWSTGPTNALSFYVLGLIVTAPQGSMWSIAPHLSGLSAAEGGYETPMGWFGAKWTSSAKMFTLSIDVPAGTQGVVKLPVNGHTMVDERSVTADEHRSLELKGVRKKSLSNEFLRKVSLLWVLDALQLFLISHALYYFLVSHFNQADVLEVSIWSLNLEIGVSVVITFIVRSFFTVRLWHLSEKNKVLVVLIIILSLAQVGEYDSLQVARSSVVDQYSPVTLEGLGLAMCALTFVVMRFDRLPTFMAPLSVQMAAAVAADVMITGPLVYYLNRNRTGFRKTNSLINRLILWSVNTALLTGVFELLQLLTWVTMTDTLVFLGFHLVLGKLYTNSMLAMLNGRKSLRANFENQIVDTSTLRIAPQTGAEQTTEIVLDSQVSFTTPSESKARIHRFPI
ncbi:hypothetical protein EW146_g8311 [Bondarzewia mesenterica]|uniref:Alpha-L-rhamnosidase six-hairpin glycosidase domain-containing protein n=1 Tax=Bondarzewia mesenterica TaxID=1095465 RepID=A0A4S4LKY7_9AGAM|nr:hypothetical protein EW146_g8311 [Bondarzewia mesenterica]